MNKPLALLFLVISVATIRSRSWQQDTEPFLNRRFALVIGANNGGSGRPSLRYAIDDARAMIKVLEDMGGIQSGDGRLLSQPTRDGFFLEMRTLADRVTQARKQSRRVEVFVYYSGHSDEENLFLADERISYREFRDHITAIDADVRIAILDSCSSGAFIQPKGVIRRSPFLLNTAYDMKGYAFITSSSGDEAAQESKRIRGSYFTHNLVTGMRGAADMNLDGRITLTEAYQFAFDATLQQTEKTLHGPQHPNYNIQMSGTGDVVVTDISQGAALLTLETDIGGKLYIHNQADVLAAELTKPAGRQLTIGLDAGTYRIILISDQAIYEARTTLTADRATRLDRKQFEKVERISTRRRGDLPLPIPQSDKKHPWELILLGGIASTSPADLNKRPRFDQDCAYFALNRFDEYNRAIGEYTFYTNEITGGLRPLRISLQGEARLQRQLTEWLSLSVGLSYLSGERTSRYENKSVIIESSGSQYIYRSTIPDYSLSVSALTPALSLKAGFPIGRRLRFGARLSIGAIFAGCRYYAVWNDFPQTEQGEVVNEDQNTGRMEQKGRGTAVTIGAGVTFDWKFGPKSGILLETGYSLRRIDHLSGPGWSEKNDVTKTWTGEWAIKGFRAEYHWGKFYGEYPSNFWQEDEPQKRVGDFILDLSGMEMKIGYYFRF